MLHGRSKRIHIRYHFIRELSSKNVVELIHCRTCDQIADCMTKALKLDTFEGLRKSMGMAELKLTDNVDAV